MHNFFIVLSHLGAYGVFEVRQNKWVWRGTNHCLLHQGLCKRHSHNSNIIPHSTVRMKVWTLLLLTCKIKVVPCRPLWKVPFNVYRPLIIAPSFLPRLQNSLLQVNYLHSRETNTETDCFFSLMKTKNIVRTWTNII